MVDEKEENNQPTKEAPPVSEKEKRIRAITLMYYSRPEIQKEIFKFSNSREIVPRFFEGFGKRPDSLQYESDVFQLAKKGATSFHCSEEIWEDPMQLSTQLSKKELDKLRKGWDLLIDIDSKYIDYSKITAELIIRTLEYHGVKNISIKFSGSKGFHILVPWKAFPEEVNGVKTSLMFPELPRIIVSYLHEKIKPLLEKRINQLDLPNKYITKNPDALKEVMPDLVLVSSRHLFRTPYSLHEKTALASVVLDKEELKNFDPLQANPMKIKIKSFIPNSIPNETKELIVEALDWYAQESKKEKPQQSGERKTEYAEIKITNLSEALYPETIKNILKGMEDGKKRSLFILINFFRSIGVERKDLENIISQWNTKNKPPIKEGYIKSQLEWSFRNKSLLPPNLDNPIYKDLGVYSDSDSRYKNPVNFTVSRHNFLNRKDENKKEIQGKGTNKEKINKKKMAK